MIVVSDTGPIHYLVLIDRIDFLRVMFETVVVPEAVVRELNQPKTPIEVQNWLASMPDWLMVRRPATLVESGLGPGETEAISLAIELGTELLVDDRGAQRLANSHGIANTGTLGVLLRADAEGLDRIDDSLERLGTTNFHGTPELFAEVRRRAGLQRRP